MIKIYFKNILFIALICLNFLNINFIYSDLHSSYFLKYRSEYDLSVVGEIWHAESIARLPILMIDMLKNDLKINYVPVSNAINFQDVSPEVIKIVETTDRKAAGDVSILLTLLSTISRDSYKFVPKNSKIKLAYVMFESDTVPDQWVSIINTEFDAIVVPDQFCNEIFKKCGVTVPIFTLPHGVYLEDFLSRPPKKRVDGPFVFGMSGVFNWRKNQHLLLQAFIEEFGNSNDIILRLHGRGGNTYEMLQDYIKQHNIKNVEIIQQVFTHKEYIDFMQSLDCYVLLTTGEGFSVSPREALALEVPCILSNNTAHKTICNTGFVRSVRCNGLAPVVFHELWDHKTKMYTTDLQDARKALRDVYENYSKYLDKASSAKEWVKQFCISNLKDFYLNLVKPKKVILSNENRVTKNCLITNSEKLYYKYLSL